MTHANSLLKFLDESPCNFFAIQNAASLLEKSGFSRLDTRERWTLKPGDRHYVIKNDSAIFAFIVGNRAEAGWKIISSHSDSPGFRIKPHPEIIIDNSIVKLNTEVYGGPILYTWFDRPLSIAGRIFLKNDKNLFDPQRLFIRCQKPLMTIPHLAIHYNRNVNDGNPLSKQKDMLPVAALINQKSEADNFLINIISDIAHVEKEAIADFDIALYDTTPACFIGRDNEFISSSRIDDLMMVYSSLVAITSKSDIASDCTRMIAVFDNEETGSGTKQGAASPVLHNILKRINCCIGGTDEIYFRAIDNSFMISADNAHALHPNYPEKQDPTNHPIPGKGPVIKINANCKYMTDALSATIFENLCQRADVPFQHFVNHSDSAGGSTLGNILTSQIDLRGVDMGAAQWAMHSCRETAASADVNYTIRVFEEFFS